MILGKSYLKSELAKRIAQTCENCKYYPRRKPYIICGHGYELPVKGPCDAWKVWGGAIYTAMDMMDKEEEEQKKGTNK